MNAIVATFFLFLLTDFTRGENFTYEGNSGPDYWGNSYHTCAGKHQSPINIEEHNVRNVSFPPLIFIGFDVPRRTMIKNNGHTVMLTAEDGAEVKITGGPLFDKIYSFEQLHFHWGKNDHEGSEVTINNRSFAMELHAVFYNAEYGNFSQAVHHDDSLAVLAYFLEASTRSNPNYSLFIESLPYIEDVKDIDTMSTEFSLGSILLPDLNTMQHYFTYRGSLTTPPCSEIVTWIDFKKPFHLSRKQIAAFRRIKSPRGDKLTHNFRPVQPLADRTVYQNFPDKSTHHALHKSKTSYRYGSLVSGQLRNEVSIVLVGISLFASKW